MEDRIRNIHRHRHLQMSQYPYYGSSSVNPGTDNETNFSIDYAHPVSQAFLTGNRSKIHFSDHHESL